MSSSDESKATYTEQTSPQSSPRTPQIYEETGQSHFRAIVFSRPSILAIACALAQAALGYDGQIAYIVPPTITMPRSLIAATNEGLGGEVPRAANDQAKFLAVRNAYGYAVILGAILTLFIGDLLGRKTNVAIGACLNGVGCIIQTSAFGPPQWLAGRVV